MAAVIDLNQIKVNVQRLRNAEPQVYERLIRLMDAYVYELLEALSETDTAEILVAKGRAQQARKFLQLFTEAPTP